MEATERRQSEAPELEEPPSKRKRIGYDPSTTTKRRKRKRKTWKDEDRELDESNKINVSRAELSSRAIASLLDHQIKRFEPDLSVIEAEELTVPRKANLPRMIPANTHSAGAIVDTCSWHEPHLTEKLPAFLRHLRDKRDGSSPLDQASKRKGSPHTLVITSIALRAADLVRVLRIFQTKDARLAKLFSKHIKLAEAIKHAQQTRMGIGVGTPTRVAELLDAGVLVVDKLERLVVDFAHMDGKTRGIVDIKEIYMPLMRLLARKDLKERFLGGSTDLAFF